MAGLIMSMIAKKSESRAAGADIVHTVLMWHAAEFGASSSRRWSRGCPSTVDCVEHDTAKGSIDMNTGSAAAMENIRQGYLNGDPVATALFIPLFFIAGAFALLQGQPF
ncbi:hypothetical protein [Nocardia grenadensis]